MKYWIAYKDGRILEQIMVAEGEEPMWSVTGDFDALVVSRLGDLNLEDFDTVTQSWKPSIAHAWTKVREERDRLLRESDYPPLYERPVEEQDKWRSYRQSLRDITETVENPLKINWPVKPK